MRQFIRHPSDVPIEIQSAPDANHTRRAARNVSFGGLAFSSDKALKPDTLISVRIPCVRPVFEVATARVAWCQKESSNFVVGVQFLDSAEAFQARMVEQICHIESYRRDIKQREGRHLTSEEAAWEWLNQYAASFPNP